MKAALSEARIAALMAARSGRLWPVGTTWRNRGGRRAFDRRTVGPMVRGGLLAEVCGTLEITGAGRARLAEVEGRR